MAAGGTKARKKKGAASAAAPPPLPDGMPPEILAALGLASLAPVGATADAAAAVLAALSSFEPGDDLGPYGEERLRADCPAYDDAISALAAAIEALRACSAEVGRVREMLNRAQHVEFGQSSESLSSLGLEPVPAAPGDTPDGLLDLLLAGDDASPRDEAAPDGAADEGGGKGDEAGDAAAGGDVQQAEKGQWPSDRKKGGKPRRTEGCADHVAKNAVRIELFKRVDESLLERLREQGYTLKRMSPTKYMVAHRFDVTFLLEVTCERFRVMETGEYLHGDTAASKPMENSPLGADVIAGILYDRYALAMTAPKVAKEALTAGLGITRQTIYRVSTQFAVALALPLVRHLLWHIVRSKCAQSDETWVRVRQELAERGRRNSVMWLVRTGEKLGIPPAVVLAHTGTRSADALADLLRDFAGKLMCDGYTAYPAALELLAEAVREADGEQAERLIVLCGCLQHVRAKFADAVQALHKCPEWKSMPPAERAKLPAARVIAAISAVFKADKDMPEGTREERAEFRRRRVRPLLDEALGLVDLYLATPLGAMDDYLGEALRYADAQREKLYEAVDDPDVALHYPQSGVIRRNAAPRSYRRAGPLEIGDNVAVRARRYARVHSSMRYCSRPFQRGSSSATAGSTTTEAASTASAMPSSHACA